MLFKSQSRSVRGYTIYAIVGSILEVVALLVVMLWILPILNIHIPWWIVTILLVVELGVSAFTYIMGRRALSKRLTFGPEAIIGSEGIVATALDPTGYVKVRGELWKASCQSELEVGDEIIVKDIEGIKLVVMPKAEGPFQSTKQTE